MVSGRPKGNEESKKSDRDTLNVDGTERCDYYSAAVSTVHQRSTQCLPVTDSDCRVKPSHVDSHHLRIFTESFEPRPLPELTTDGVQSSLRPKQTTFSNHQSPMPDGRSYVAHSQSLGALVINEPDFRLAPATVAAAAPTPHLMVMSLSY